MTAGITIGFDEENAFNKLIARVQNQKEGVLQQIIDLSAAGAQGVIVKAYNTLVYQTELGAFGYPKNDSQLLAQSVEIAHDRLAADVFPTRQEALYVEFGTGIFATVGPKQRIRPKRAKLLAFPVWSLPVPREDFTAIFIPRENDKTGKLPPGAIGTVLARSVAGMKPRPIWKSEPVLNAILKLVELYASKVQIK